MSNPSHTLRSLLHRLGVVGPARLRAFQGSGASKGTGAPSPRRALATLATLVATLAALALTATPASAATIHPFLSELNGSNTPATEFGLLGAVAVDSHGDLYVPEVFGSAIDVFDSQGNYLTRIAEDLNLSYPTSVAVDSAGNLYAASYFGGVVKFTPSSYPVTAATTYSFQATIDPSGTAVAVDPVTDSVYVVESTQIAEYDSSGTPVTTIGSGTLVEARGVAVDGSSGDVYVSDPAHKVLDVFDSSGSLLSQIDGHTRPRGSFSGGGVGGLGIEQSSGYIFVVESAADSVDEFEADGAFVSEISHTYFQVSSLSGVALDNSGGATAGDVYVSGATGSREVVDVFGPGLVVPTSTTKPASPVDPTTATLNGEVDPASESVALKECFFEWGTEAGVYGHTAACEHPDAAEVATGTSPVSVHAKVEGLVPATAYHFRLRASNENDLASPSEGLDESFFTPSPPVVSSSTADVTSTSAELRGQINPEGSETTYYFQYVDEATYRADVSSGGPGHGFDHATDLPDVAEGAVPIGIGSGSADVSVSAHLQGLQPETIYHYRVVATNANGTTSKPEHTFTTQGPGGAYTLPDDRAYEMVSPPDNNGNDVFFDAGDANGNVQSAISGNAIAFTVFEGAFPGSHTDLVINSYLASRGSGGWTTQALMPPQAPSPGVLLGLGSPAYGAFSADLSKGILLDGGEVPPQAQDSPPLVSGEPLGYENLFVRDFASGSYQLLTDVTPPSFSPNTPPTMEGYVAVFEGASADFSHAIFEANDALTANAPGGKVHNLYEWVGGQLSLVGVLPDGTVAPNGAEPGNAESGSAAIEPTISADGSRIFFRTPGAAQGGQLYVRENGDQPQSPLDGEGNCTVPADACTLQVSGSQKTNGTGPAGTDPNGPQPPTYWTEATDGSNAFFTSCEQLTNDSTAASPGSESSTETFCTPDKPGVGNDLYRFDAEAPAGERLTDLTVDHADPLGAQVQGVVGAANDGSYVYFVATGDLTGAEENERGEKAQSGQPNLYLSHDGTTTFIATLDPSDEFDWGRYAAGLSGGPATVDGTSARVTPDGEHLAFDSTKSLTGYDNTDANTDKPDTEIFLYDAASGQLTCASCNPSGDQPTGGAALDVDTHYETFPQYAPRQLSDDGSRLFFDTTDSLLPGASNGLSNVYEYEGGQLHLISNGAGSHPSYFMDASPSGNDVFFATADQLVSQDSYEEIYQANVDIYDARVGGGFPAPTTPIACEGDACSTPVPAPNDPTPGSLTFSGAGNLPSGAQPMPVVVKRTAAQIRAEKLAKALKACRAKHNRHRRAVCKAQARKRYGSKAKAKKTTTNNRRAAR